MDCIVAYRRKIRKSKQLQTMSSHFRPLQTGLLGSCVMTFITVAVDAVWVCDHSYSLPIGPGFALLIPLAFWPAIRLGPRPGLCPGPAWAWARLGPGPGLGPGPAWARARRNCQKKTTKNEFVKKQVGGSFPALHGCMHLVVRVWKILFFHETELGDSWICENRLKYFKNNLNHPSLLSAEAGIMVELSTTLGPYLCHACLVSVVQLRCAKLYYISYTFI